MKLTDLKRHQAALRRRPPKTTEVFKDCDLWMARGGASDLGEADVEVEFDYTPASFSDHPYGSGTAREHHPSSLDIQSVTLVKIWTLQKIILILFSSMLQIILRLILPRSLDLVDGRFL
jgi:hypothetical protein